MKNNSNGRGRIGVTTENSTGRNTGFVDRRTGQEMTRPELVSNIRNGLYPNYHVRVINGVETPVSNPDGKPGNNLG